MNDTAVTALWARLELLETKVLALEDYCELLAQKILVVEGRERARLKEEADDARA